MYPTKKSNINGIDTTLYVPNPDDIPDRILLFLAPFDMNLDNITTQNTAIALISGMDWDNDLTPWPAPGVMKGDAAMSGNSSAFLRLLQSEIMPAVATMAYGDTPHEFEWVLGGVSLSGLFAVWSATLSQAFSKLIAISGSFWYDGFVKWFADATIKHSGMKAYLSLGNKEKDTRVKRFKSIETDTMIIVEQLRKKGVGTVFHMDNGTHYSPLEPRLQEAITALQL